MKLIFKKIIISQTDKYDGLVRLKLKTILLTFGTL